MKKVLSVLLVLAMALGLCSAALAEPVSLLVWVGDDLDTPWIEGVIERFKAAYPDTEFDIQVGVESESTCKDTVLTDPEAAADVFTFASDQLGDLMIGKALMKVELDADAVIEASGGADSAVVASAIVDGDLYAYPATADNGYFMYYNKKYFTEDDVQSLTKMLDIAAENGKYVAMEMSSGWYMLSFFKGAGLTISNNAGVNECDWNTTDATIKGVDVAQAMLDITANKGFICQNDGEFQTGVKDGSVIAGINGAWNASTVKTAWGDDYAACKLPTYTVAGQEIQMGSMGGGKMVGVNAYCSDEKAYYAMLFAEFMTNYDSQVSRFELREQGPSNALAASSETVQSNLALAALAAQSPYCFMEGVAGNYWDNASAFGAIIVSGNPDATPLQTLLDNMVIGITAE